MHAADWKDEVPVQIPEDPGPDLTKAMGDGGYCKWTKWNNQNSSFIMVLYICPNSYTGFKSSWKGNIEQSTAKLCIETNYWNLQQYGRICCSALVWSGSYKSSALDQGWYTYSWYTGTHRVTGIQGYTLQSLVEMLQFHFLHHSTSVQLEIRGG